MALGTTFTQCWLQDLQGANKKMDPLPDKFAPSKTIFPAILRILTATALCTVKLDFKNIFGHCHFGSKSQVVFILMVLKANLVKLVIGDLVLKIKLVLILTVLKANLFKLVIGVLVLKAKLVLILTVLKVEFDYI